MKVKKRLAWLLVIGVIGGFVGSLLLSLVGIHGDGFIGNIIVSVIGACAFIAIVRAIRK